MSKKTTKITLAQHHMEVELSEDWLRVLVASGLRAHVASRYDVSEAFKDEPTFRSYLAETLDSLGIPWIGVDVQ